MCGGNNIEGILISPKQAPFKNLEVCNFGPMLIPEIKECHQSFNGVFCFAFFLSISISGIHVYVAMCGYGIYLHVY